jgi:hypothetical protein
MHVYACTHTHTHICTHTHMNLFEKFPDYWYSSSLMKIQCVRKVAVHLGYGTWIWLSVLKFTLKYAVVSLYSVVKQQLKRPTGKVCNCLIQFLLTMVLSIEDRVFLVEYVFQEGNRYMLMDITSNTFYKCTATF